MELCVFQSLWAMGGLPYAGSEWSTKEQVEKIVEGDFDGIEIAWIPASPADEAVKWARSASLPFGLVCIPASVAEFRASIEEIRRLEHSPVYIDIQPAMKVFNVSEGVTILRECVQVSNDAGFRTRVETHRDRMTTDLRFTLLLMDEFPEMRMNADLAHYVVGQEFAWPVGEEDQALIRRVIERSDMFHGRVASNQQVQLSVGWDLNRRWVDLFLGWWEEGFRLWRKRADEADGLVFVTEMGPPPYAITGQDGRELSDRWEEALLMKSQVRDVWQRLEAASASASASVVASAVTG